jgi:hypothetical protein
VRRDAELGYVAVVVADACGAGDEAAGRRSLKSLTFAGASLVTEAAAVSATG